MLPIDHLLWATPDLEQGIATIAGLLGVTPAVGGVHPGGGTRNALLSLGQRRYFEILAPDPAQDGRGTPAEWMPALARPGLVTWVVATRDLDAVVARAAALEIKTRGVISASRDKPGGGKLHWRVVRISGHGFGSLVPFFIDWTDSPHPSASTPAGCTLDRLEIGHPRADQLNRLFDAFDIAQRAQVAAAPSLAALVDCPKGKVTLQAAAPLPDGWRD
jgi:hypothetical protein